MYNEKTIEKLKQKILDLAIRGKLVPQDPNDEPASILIEKIRKEKEKLIKEGKIKKPKEDSFIFKGSDNCYYENVNGKVKCIQDEIPFEIPESWMWVRLGNICEINLGFTYKPTYYSNGIPFLSVSNLKDNEIDYNNCNYISFEEYKKASYGSKPLKGDILFGRVGSIGRPQIVNVDFPFCIFVSLGFLRFFSFPIYNKYVLLYLNSNLFTKFVKNIAKGTGRINLNTGWLYTFLFPLPSINEQFNIVDKYESIYGKTKSLENIFDEKNKNKKLLKLKVLDYIFSPNSSYKSYYENEFNLGDILEYEQPAPYIVKNTDYNDSFDTPVLTPGKTFILGYTNEKDGIYKADKDNKVIIFDDFTTASRLVDFDFKVKSSAMKILHISDKTKYDIDYMYYLLQTINIIVDTHKRFWISEYAPLKVKIHKFEEQVKIKNRINSIFKTIDNL